jgi:histidinol dehydrogenase
VAADLIAQAEHGSGDESAVLVTPSRRIAGAVNDALVRALTTLPRAAAVRQVLAKRGAAVVVRSLAEGFEIANQIGPEHLELEIDGARRFFSVPRARRPLGITWQGRITCCRPADRRGSPLRWVHTISLSEPV